MDPGRHCLAYYNDEHFFHISRNGGSAFDHTAGTGQYFCSDDIYPDDRSPAGIAAGGGPAKAEMVAFLLTRVNPLQPNSPTYFDRLHDLIVWSHYCQTQEIHPQILANTVLNNHQNGGSQVGSHNKRMPSDTVLLLLFVAAFGWDNNVSFRKQSLEQIGAQPHHQQVYRCFVLPFVSFYLRRMDSRRGGNVNNFLRRSPYRVESSLKARAKNDGVWSQNRMLWRAQQQPDAATGQPHPQALSHGRDRGVCKGVELGFARLHALIIEGYRAEDNNNLAPGEYETIGQPILGVIRSMIPHRGGW